MTDSAAETRDKTETEGTQPPLRETPGETLCEQCIASMSNEVEILITEVLKLRGEGKHFEANKLAIRKIGELVSGISTRVNGVQESVAKNCLSRLVEKKVLQREMIIENTLSGILEAMLNGISDPAFCANAEGICVACNEAFLTALQKNSEDVIGRPVLEVAPNLRPVCEQVAINGGSHHEEVTCGNGAPNNVSVNTISLLERSFRIAVIHDLSEDRAIKEMSADAFGNASIARAMIDGLSHNGRTAINQIVGAIQVLKEGDNSEDWLRIIEEGIQKLSSLIDRFSGTQIESNPLEVNTFSPRELLQEAIDELSLSKKKEARLDVRGKKKLPDKITTDSVKLKEILQHLIRSALSFAKEDDVTIQGSMNEEDEVQFTIEYHGIRASTALQRTLFAGLFEAGENGEPKFNFFAARQLAEAIGGRIEVEGSKGKTYDTFQLHLIIPAEIQPTEEKTAPAIFYAPSLPPSLPDPPEISLEQMTEAQLIERIPEELNIVLVGLNPFMQKIASIFLRKKLEARKVHVSTAENRESVAILSPMSILEGNENPTNLAELADCEEKRRALWIKILQRIQAK